MFEKTKLRGMSILETRFRSNQYLAADLVKPIERVIEIFGNQTW